MPSSRIASGAPAEYFHDAFLLGNGRLGATTYGRVGQERWDLNLDTLWSGGPRTADSAVPEDTADLVAPLRAAITAGDHARAEELAYALQGRYRNESFQPLGTLTWRYAAEPTAGDAYERVLDLESAVSSTTHPTGDQTVVVSSYVSAPDQVLVVTLDGPSGWTPAGTAEVSSPHPALTERPAADRPGGTLSGRVPAHVPPVWTDDDGGPVYATVPPGADGTVPAGMAFAVAWAERDLGDGRHQLLLAATDGYRGFDQRPSADEDGLREQAWAILTRALERSAAELLQRHRDDYRELFERCRLRLTGSTEVIDPALVTTFFDLGRYLMIASSRAGTQPTNLQGIWNPDLQPAWSSNWTANINLEMNYWAAEPAGLPECVEPLLTLIEDLHGPGADAARRHYGSDGWAVHHNVDVWRSAVPAPGDPVWANWPTGSLWLTSHLWEHWRYAPDDPNALPALARGLEASVRFALDLLVPYDGDDRRLVVSPSTSPEHKFVAEDGSLRSVSAGSAMDQELVTEVFSRFLQLADVPHVGGTGPGFPPDLVDRVRDALTRVRPVQIGTHGRLLEWDVDRPPAERGHRHCSFLYGLHPGEQFTAADTPTEFAAARAALDDRIAHGGGGTGWSQAWILCFAARLGDPDLVERSLRILAADLTSRSLLDLHPYRGKPEESQFQIDGNLGAVAGLLEVFVRSQRGVVSVANAVPEHWSGALTGARTHGGHRVDLGFDAGRLSEVVLTAGTTGPVSVELPAWSASGSVRVDGVAVVPSVRSVGERVRVDLEVDRGARLVITT